jgi:hypothetical protein
MLYIEAISTPPFLAFRAFCKMLSGFCQKLPIMAYQKILSGCGTDGEFVVIGEMII